MIYRKGYQLETLTGLDKTIKDINDLKVIGVNLIRYPIYLSFKPDLAKWLTDLKVVINHCNALDIKVMVCLHHPNRNNASTQEILDVNQFLIDWQTITSTMLGYNFVAIPINEPHAVNQDINLRLIYKRLIPIITGRTICFSVPGVTIDAITKWKPIPGATNQWTEVHCYDFNFGTETNSKQYPVGRKNKTTLRNKIRKLSEWSKAWDSPVYIGETAIKYDVLGAKTYLKDFMQICKEFKIPYTLHAFREWEGWDYEKRLVVWETIKEEMK